MAGDARPGVEPTDLPTDLEALKRERQKVYGDPRENHDGIAKMWACLLQPHAEAIARQEPIPAATVALMMAALKINRCRRVFHQDNYDDARCYLDFAEEFQREDAARGAHGDA